jgi:hypothetical protein
MAGPKCEPNVLLSPFLRVYRRLFFGMFTCTARNISKKVDTVPEEPGRPKKLASKPNKDRR